MFAYGEQVFAFDRTVSRLLEMQSEEYTNSYYSEWLQRRQLPVVSALMEAVAVQASEEEKGAPPQDTNSSSVTIASVVERGASTDLVPSFIVDALDAKVIRQAWDSYCSEHSEAKSVPSTEDAPKIFARALELSTGQGTTSMNEYLIF